MSSGGIYDKCPAGESNRRSGATLAAPTAITRVFAYKVNWGVRTLRRRSPPAYNTPRCEAPMPFTLRLYQRFPVHCRGLTQVKRSGHDCQ
jgi:hypothetical protein